MRPMQQAVAAVHLPYAVRTALISCCLTCTHVSAAEVLAGVPDHADRNRLSYFWGLGRSENREFAPTDNVWLFIWSVQNRKRLGRAT